MWFYNLMDDFKKSVIKADENRGIFVPVFLKLLVGLIVVIFFIATVIKWTFTLIRLEENYLSQIDVGKILLKEFGLTAILAYLIFIIVYVLIEIGTLSLIKAVIYGGKPTRAVFFSGIKTYLLKVLGGQLLIHFALLLLSPIWMVLMVIGFVLIGITTGGWGILAISAFSAGIFATWTIAIINGDHGVVGGIKASISLLRREFKSVMLVELALIVVPTYTVSLFGPIGALLAGWFISGVLGIAFKMVFYYLYLRANNLLIEDQDDQVLSVDQESLFINE